MEWLIANWDTILAGIKVVVAGVTGIVTGFSVIAQLTPTQTDNEFLGKILKFIDKLALNNTPTEVKSSNVDK